MLVASLRITLLLGLFLLLLSQSMATPLNVFVLNPDTSANRTIPALQATFGPNLSVGGQRGVVVIVQPEKACSTVSPPSLPSNVTWIALIKRGECSFATKVTNAQTAGAALAIVYNNISTQDNQLVHMSAYSDVSNIVITSLFISYEDGMELLDLLAINSNLEVSVVNDETPSNWDDEGQWTVIVFIGILAILISSFFILVFLVVEIYRQRRRRRAGQPKPVAHTVVISLPMKDITQEFLDGPEHLITCAVCLDDFAIGDAVRELPCKHLFHLACIDPWLLRHNRVCPTCKQDIHEGLSYQPATETIDDATPINQAGQVMIEMDDMSGQNRGARAEGQQTASSSSAAPPAADTTTDAAEVSPQPADSHV